MRKAVLAMTVLLTAMPAAAAANDAHIVRCIALLDIVSEMRINDPQLERPVRRLYVEDLRDKGALARLAQERAYLLDHPAEWASAADPYGCGAYTSRWLREGRLKPPPGAH
jgi:hypothetical protein